MDEKLYEMLMKLPKANLIHIMWDALDSMQAYNGRSRTTCICMGMGAEEKVDDNDKISYKVKSIKEVKKFTETMGL